MYLRVYESTRAFNTYPFDFILGSSWSVSKRLSDAAIANSRGTLLIKLQECLLSTQIWGRTADISAVSSPIWVRIGPLESHNSGLSNGPLFVRIRQELTEIPVPLPGGTRQGYRYLGQFCETLNVQ